MVSSLATGLLLSLLSGVEVGASEPASPPPASVTTAADASPAPDTQPQAPGPSSSSPDAGDLFSRAAAAVAAHAEAAREYAERLRAAAEEARRREMPSVPRVPDVPGIPAVPAMPAVPKAPPGLPHPEGRAREMDQPFDFPMRLGSPTDAGMRPDVYPSRRAAARALGEAWAAEALRAAPSRWPYKVRVRCEDLELSQELRTGLMSRLPGVTVTDTPDPRPARARAGGGGQDGGGVVVDLTVSESVESAPSRRGRGEPRRPGAASLSLAAAGWPSATARYVDKPWVDDFGAFAAARGAGRWIVGHSERPTTAAPDAADAARRDAAASLLPIVHAHLYGTTGPAGPTVPHAWLAQRLEAALLDNRNVADTFTQKFERPYGTVWRESVLVDASPAAIEGLAAELRHVQTVRHVARRNTVFAAVALLLVIYALYRFADAYTRGYFTWSLRAAVVVILSAGVVAGLAMLG